MSRPVPRPYCPTCGKRVAKIQRIYCEPACYEAVRRTPFVERFWRQVAKLGEKECWLWVGPRVRGYGVVRDGNQAQRKAHRVAYEMAGGKVPPGMLVCHHCDTPRCVNPAHLFVGTHQDNMRDRFQKGRHKLCGHGRKA